MKANILMVILITLFLISCNEKKAKIEQNKETTLEIAVNKEPSESYTLFKNNCYACHSVTTKSHDEIIAPPMVAVKRRYKMSYNSKEDFVEAVVAWASDPKEENALMRGAVNQFKVMPKQLFKKEDLVKIAAYIYDTKIEQPAWFGNHFNTMHPNGMGNGMGRGKGMKNKNN